MKDDLATTESVLQHHLQCFGSGDLDGIISGYTEKSVLFLPSGVTAENPGDP